MLKAFNHPIATLREGLNSIIDGEAKPLPLNETHFTIEVENGLALIRTLRVFSNNDERSIEAILTFPVSFDAVLTGLKAEIDGRKLLAHAKLKDAAREDYEEAVSKGKMAILHEEPLRGLHMLSVGQLGPGKTVRIETEMVMPLATNGSTLYLRLPLVVGEIYGVSPFLPADDLVAVAGLNLSAVLTVTAQGGRVTFADSRAVENGQKIMLDRHLVLQFPDQFFGQSNGIDAWGRRVKLLLAAPSRSDRPLDIAVLVDHSSSTGGVLGEGRVHQAMLRGLAHWGSSLRPEDKISLWEFNDKTNFIGHANGAQLVKMIDKLSPPSGGTELGKAVDSVIKQGSKPILVLTDGQTYNHEIRQAQEGGCPIHAILVGEGSLDAMIGHLAAQTGGQVIAALHDDVGGALNAVLPVLRKGHIISKGQLSNDKPEKISTMRGGIVIDVLWSDTNSDSGSDAVGRYAASLTITLAQENVAGQIAMVHGLSSHLTSLIIVDDAGEAVKGLPRMVKVPVHGLNNNLAPTSNIDNYLVNKSITPMLNVFNDSEKKSIHLRKVSQRDANVGADWSLVTSNLLLQSAELPAFIAERVRILMDDKDVVTLAQSCGMQTYTVALLIVAFQDRTRDRNAGRFIRSCKNMVTSTNLLIIETKAKNI